ncbi:MAG TPA: iron uptake transporter permease EfeU [Candidatus Limnocylindrales bacterium]|nr:iron uptake transporter permease EfeU [Candidatus Limnocylindrales bacterium]
MTAAFFVTLREGLEAALIVGIIVAYLVKVGRREAVRFVAYGVAAAVAVSVVVGAAVVTTVGELPEVAQETFEGIAALLAVVVLTWMLFWMRRQGRAMKGELEASVDAALGRGSTLALAGLAFVAVAREGLETVLFMLAILGSSENVAVTMFGAVIGLVVAVAIGWAIFAMGVRVSLRQFFTVTGIVLIFVSAGLLAQAVHEFTEAGWLPETAVAFDLSGILSRDGLLGSVLAGLLGFRPAPTWSELIAYFAYLIPVLLLFLAPSPVPARRAVASE